MIKRLIEYAAYETTSDPASESFPSSDKERILANRLLEDVKALGIKDAFVDEYGYVYGSLEANAKGPVIGLIAHMDTSDAVSGKDVKARVIENYDGEDIRLNETLVSEVSRFPELKQKKGKTLIVTDGNTLLGGDDKAGIVIIMEVLETLMKDAERKHPRILFCFNPDEEVGRGTEHFNYDWFQADFAYTLDGQAPEAIECENFNAASAQVKVKGISTHPGSAKDKMINALNVAYEFHRLLPYNMRPENTEGYEGFNHLVSMQGECIEASLSYILRNHDTELLEAQKADFYNARDFLNRKYRMDLVEVEIKDAYRNMKQKFAGHEEILQLAEEAIRLSGLKPRYEAIRGGTDGAELTWHGLLCPNLGTGAYNLHGKHEYVVAEEMEKMAEITLHLLTLAVKEN